MKHALKTALFVAAITVATAPAFASIIIQDAAPTPTPLLELLALLRH